MKKILLLFTVVTLVACNSASETQSKSKEQFTRMDEDLTVTTDTVTGCKYVIYNGGNKGGIIQMLKANGRPDCD